jgi:cephalosporin hydroxylase
MNPIEEFENSKSINIKNLGKDIEAKNSALGFMMGSAKHQYTYNFTWMGRPIIQYPQDMIAMQELIWSIQPDLIIETGIAHGGSLIFSAAMLELNAICGGSQDAFVLGLDIDIRKHNHELIEAHPMFKRISMIQGSSIDPQIVEQVKIKAARKQKILLFLDSNHTHDHVLAELEAYAPLVSIGSYCVVFDTAIEDLPNKMFDDRPWGVGNNPKTAVWEYLKSHPEFEIDKSIEHKLLITVAPDGYLKRIR